MNALDIVKIVLVVAILGGFGYIVYDYRAVKAENARLTTQLTAANSTITALDNLVKKNAEIMEKTDEMIEQIEKEPEGNDALTAPVLRSAIERLH